MRVVIQIRADVARYVGGEAIAVRETARGLAELGVQCQVTSDLGPNLRGVDLVHVFGITQPTEGLIQARHATRAGLPIVVSPIYQDLTEYDGAGRYGVAALAHRLPPVILDQIKAAVRRGMSARNGGANLPWFASSRAAQQRELIGLCRVMLPNSEAERRAVEADFGIDIPAVVVPNGVSDRLAHGDATAFVQKYGVRDFVLSVGVITSLKNQLRLIEAVEPTGWPLVLIGDRVATHAGYHRAVSRAITRSAHATRIHAMPSEALADAYAAARVIALPSWFETCGMVCLEGALAGCRVAITNRGFTADYFGQDAAYCDPGDVGSIRRAVAAAYSAEPSARLTEQIRTLFTWQNAAARTLEGYTRALDHQ